jgi:hypothetical protein
MTGMMRVSLLTIAAALLINSPAGAQSVDLHEMNFDLWCQQEANLPPERCDKRLPDDNARFEAYRKKIEDYEVPYLQQREQNQHLNQVLLHNDPVDHPTEPSQPATPDTAAAPHSDDVPPK